MFQRLVDEGQIPQREEPTPPRVPKDLAAASKAGEVRRLGLPVRYCQS